jgi:hypothetical protein
MSHLHYSINVLPFVQKLSVQIKSTLTMSSVVVSSNDKNAGDPALANAPSGIEKNDDTEEKEKSDDLVKVNDKGSARMTKRRLSHVERVQLHAGKAKHHAKKTFNCVGEYLKRRKKHAQQLAQEQAAAAKKLVAQTLIMRHGEGLTDRDAKKIAERLNKENGLLFVDIHGNKIGDEGVIELGKALKENNTLKNLMLWNNPITNKGAKYLAECLKENTGLKVLELDHCQISGEGMAAIGNALRVNTGLEALTLSKNVVGHSFVQFAKDLAVNKTLKRLDLRCCGINDVGAASLAKCIRQNSSLVEINLKGNNITGVGAHCLMEAVQENHSLARLRILKNKLTNTEQVEFVKCMVKYLQPPPEPPVDDENVAEVLAKNMLKGGTYALKGSMLAGLKGAKMGLKGAKAGISAGIKGAKLGASVVKSGVNVVKKGANSVKVAPKKIV